MMGDKEVLEIHNLDDDDLLAVYKMVEEHIQYLNQSIIDTTIDEGGEVTNE